MVWPVIWPFGRCVIWPVTDLFQVPLVIIRVAHSWYYVYSTIIMPVIALLYVSLVIICVARTRIYLLNTILW